MSYSVLKLHYLEITFAEMLRDGEINNAYKPELFRSRVCQVQLFTFMRSWSLSGCDLLAVFIAIAGEML